MMNVSMSAEISKCKLYRYMLHRQWDDGAYALPIIMLNPSIADASIDDPTIKRCMSFAQRDGFGGIRVFNLFAFRATDPADMMSAKDPVGPEGDHYIQGALDASLVGGIPILAAWGVHGSHQGRADHVIGMARRSGANLQCLGKTKDGCPRHPLYVKGDLPFIPLV